MHFQKLATDNNKNFPPVKTLWSMLIGDTSKLAQRLIRILLQGSSAIREVLLAGPSRSFDGPQHDKVHKKLKNSNSALNYLSDPIQDENGVILAVSQLVLSIIHSEKLTGLCGAKIFREMPPRERISICNEALYFLQNV